MSESVLRTLEAAHYELRYCAGLLAMLAKAPIGKTLKNLRMADYDADFDRVYEVIERVQIAILELGGDQIWASWEGDDANSE